MEIGLSAGPYLIVSKLGAGGMGEVYRARDSRLGRDVAIKVLHGRLHDAETRRRLTLEANATAALNHPNIVAVFDVNLEGDNPYVVTELVDGDSLRKPLERGPVPLPRLLDIATQIADGMAAAHEASIVHLDLKPENILLTRSGRIKIVDFGLARSLSSPPQNPGDDFDTLPMSSLGVIAGTVDYMSPEQASGNRVDTRSDVFSFGLILYEMAAGRRAFVSRSKVETLSAIINNPPPPMPASVPAPLRWCIERCLAKDPTRRYNSTLDLYNELCGIKERLPALLAGNVAVASPTGTPGKRRLATKSVPMFSALAVLLAGALGLAVWRAPDTPDPAAFRFQPLATAPESEDWPVYSQQGGMLAYHATVDGRTQIFTRGLEAPSAVQVTHCAANCDRPEWSADGSQLFFRYKGGVWVVGAAGGDPTPVVSDVEAYTLSPDGKTLAFIRRSSDFGAVSVWTSTPPNASPVRYEPAPFGGVHASTGVRLLFTPDGKRILFWARFFGHEHTSEFWMLPYPVTSGKPRRILDALEEAFPVRGFHWLPGGRRLVIAATLPPNVYRSHLYIADVETGSVRMLFSGIGSESVPAVSPDGKQIAYTAMDYDADLVEIPLDGSPPRNILATSRLEHSPAWSPRGPELAYVTDRGGSDEIWVRNTQTGREQPIVRPRNFPHDDVKFLTSPEFSPDGERIAFVRQSLGDKQNRNSIQIWISPANGGTPIPLTSLKGGQWAPTWSPEGNWIAFTSQGQPPSQPPGIMKARVGVNEPPVMLWPMDISLFFCVAAWSPRGDWIALPSKNGTVLISPDGKKTRVLRKPFFAAMAWSRDGATLFGLEEAGERQRIFSVDVASGQEREIAKIPSSVTLRSIWVPGRKMSLSPDGKSLATTSVRQSGDIWLLENFEVPTPWRRLFRGPA